MADVVAAAYASLTEEDLDDQSRIVPVVGEPGSGKSHLVRWAYEQLREQRWQGNSRFLAVYLPRQRASFAGMVEALEEAIEIDGDRSAKEVVSGLRQRVSAITALTAEELAQRVLLDMRQRLRRLPRGDHGGEALPSLLADLLAGDGAVERWFVSPASPIGRRTRHLLGEHDESDEAQSAAEEEHDRGFALDDLSALGKITPVSPTFAEAYRMVGPDRDQACVLLNRVLEEGLSAQLQSETTHGAVSLSDAFKAIRTALAVSGTDLVLLVEDLVSFEGLGRTLLDTLIEPPEDGVCRLRALIASTGNYWGRLLDEVGTLGDRLIAPTYMLELAGVDEAQQHAILLELTALYLNAARVGARRLESELNAATGSWTTSWVPPSGCSNCPLQEPCHLAFGFVERRQDGEHLGLFPFTANAVKTIYLNVGRRNHASETTLNPRRLVRQVLLPTLQEGAHALREGSFPNQALIARFSTPGFAANAKNSLANQSYTDSQLERAAAVAECWGSQTDGIVELDGQVATAFGLPPLPPLPVAGTAPPLPRPSPSPSPSPGKAPSSLSESLSSWLSDGHLGQRERNEVRQLLFDAALERVPWPELAAESAAIGTSEIRWELGLRTHEHSVAFLDGEAEPPPTGHSVIAEIERTNDSFVLLASLAEITEQAKNHQTLRGGALLAVANGIEPIARNIRGIAEERGFSRQGTIAPDEPGLVALVVGSLLCEQDGTVETNLDLAHTLLKPTGPPAEGDSSPLAELRRIASQGLNAVSGDLPQGKRASRETAREWAIRRVTIRQGSQPLKGSEIRLVDAPRLIDAVAGMTRQGAVAVPVVDPGRPVGDGSRSFARLANELLGDKLDRCARTIARTWKRVNEVAPRYGCDLDSPKAWLEALNSTTEEVVRLIAELQREQREPTGDAYRTTTENLRELIELRRDEEWALRRIRFGLAFDSTDASVANIALLGQLGAQAEALGSAIVTFSEAAAAVLEVTANSLNAVERPAVIDRFNDEFEHAFASTLELLGGDA